MQAEAQQHRQVGHRGGDAAGGGEGPEHDARRRAHLAEAPLRSLMGTTYPSGFLRIPPKSVEVY